MSLSLDSIYIMHYKIEKNARRKVIRRELSREVFAVSINKAKTVLGTDTHSSVLHSGKSWLNCAIKQAIFSILTQRSGCRRPGYRDCHIYLIVSLGLSTNLSI